MLKLVPLKDQQGQTAKRKDKKSSNKPQRTIPRLPPIEQSIVSPPLGNSPKSDTSQSKLPLTSSPSTTTSSLFSTSSLSAHRNRTRLPAMREIKKDQNRESTVRAEIKRQQEKLRRVKKHYRDLYKAGGCGAFGGASDKSALIEKSQTSPKEKRVVFQ